MPKRGYLELTPGELQARRLIFGGGALFVMPPLLSLCHMQQFVCETFWRSGVASLAAMVPFFPWLLPVGALMLAGFVTATVGATLLLCEKAPVAHRGRPDPAHRGLIQQTSRRVQ
jgi:hypothetical protein